MCLNFCSTLCCLCLLGRYMLSWEVAESQPMSTMPSSGTRVVSTQTRQMLSRHEVTSMFATAPLGREGGGQVRSGRVQMVVSTKTRQMCPDTR